LQVCPQSEFEVGYSGHERVLVNVGSVGQPRDEDPRAAYGLVDTKRQTVSVRRVPYDIAAVQAKIRKVGLPEVLANRLSLGV
jgi:diadenosine tetraphosphatase ApaH/serine/threonine PP2A family protein phosphatase